MGREWLDAIERWRAYLVAAEEREHEFDGPDVAELFCSDCSEREFSNA